MTQPSISFQVQSLEKELGIKLFNRNKQTISLTKQGKLYYRYAKEIISLNKQAINLMHLDENIEEQIIVAVDSIAGSYLVPRLLGCFKRKHPEICIVFKMGNTDEVQNWLQKDLVDICVVQAENIRNDNFIAESFIEDELVLVVSPEHPLSQKDTFSIMDLYNVKLILREQGSGIRKIITDRLLKQGINLEKLNISMEISDNEAIKEIVQSGLGTAFLSRWAIVKEKQLELLKELKNEEDLFRYKICVLTREEKKDIRVINTLKNFILSRKVKDFSIRCNMKTAG